MRKILVIALMVALVPFAVGCRVGGLWGFDDDTGTTVGGPAATPVAGVVTVTPVLKLPIGLAAAPSAAIRMLTSVLDLYITMPDGTILRVVGATNDGTTWTVTFETYAVPAGTVFTSNQADLAAIVNLGGTQTFTSTLKVTNTSSSTTVPAANTSTITVDATSGTLVVTVGTVNTVTGTTSTTGASTSTLTTTTIAAQDFFVKSVLWGTATVTADMAAAIAVDDLTPDFVVKLSADFADLTTYSFECKNVTDGTTVTLSNANQSVTVTPDHTNTKITFAVVGTTAPYRLEAGKTYKVTLMTPLAKAGDANKTVTGLVRYFKTTAGATVK